MVWTVDNSVHLLPSEEENDLRAAVRTVLESAGDVDAVRQTSSTDIGYSPELWRQMTDSMSVTTMTIPEASGGLGFGLQYLCTVIEECGRALRPEPVLSSAAIGLQALLLSRGAEAEELRVGALSGRMIIAPTSLTTDADKLTATETPSGWTIDGTARVVGPPNADIVVATADTNGRRSLFAVPPSQGVSVRPLHSIDPTRAQADVHCVSAAAILLSPPGTADEEIRRLWTRGVITLAAENVGIAEHLFEMTREYTRSRKQFGRTIASFQAIKHRLADMFLDVERARSAARYAAALFDSATQRPESDASDLEQLELAAAVAGAVCGDAAIRVATEAIQLHGGIGFTWEHPAHSYYRRVLTNETLFGTPTQHRQRIASLATSTHAAA
ncbi:acyl-CoA dehydrogenase [Prescottella equi]|uniref:acyl-CoA dehydrogenase family protein n=1 Tax=Rhodococcus hoagii TaxID=43767 RepID=UPI000A103BAD|nr:acyl-CoA dehydrogenase family protein [Prescottella equi]ORJ92574.1 acyl-CoA dehydrogenase [Prescottella equi]